MDDDIRHFDRLIQAIELARRPYIVEGREPPPMLVTLRPDFRMQLLNSRRANDYVQTWPQNTIFGVPYVVAYEDAHEEDFVVWADGRGRG